MSYSIRFPFTRERTGYRRGPRFRRVVDCSALSGARFCAAKMINCAILYRDAPPAPFLTASRTALNIRICRLGMRCDALWARVFAGQIDQHDPRIDAAYKERHALAQELCARTEVTA